MSVIKFITMGNQIRTFRSESDTVFDKLPPRVYSVGSDRNGYYLEISKDKFLLPNTLYGNIKDHAKKIISTYNDRKETTGVLLTGIKGAGKTLLAKYTANILLKENTPVILINEPYTGDDFLQFIESIGNVVLLFDEFGKNYAKDVEDSDVPSQEKLLTLFDGLMSSKKLIILTENDIFNINRFLLNRPGRLYYHFKYDTLPNDVIAEYCKEYELNYSVIEKIKKIQSKVAGFSFDILQSLVEEYKRYGTDVDNLIEDMNISIPSPNKLQVDLIYNKLTKTYLNIDNDELLIRDITKRNGTYVSCYENISSSEKDAPKYEKGALTKAVEKLPHSDSNNIRSFDHYFQYTDLVQNNNNKYIFDNGDIVLTCTLITEYNFDYSIFS